LHRSAPKKFSSRKPRPLIDPSTVSTDIRSSRLREKERIDYLESSTDDEPQSSEDDYEEAVKYSDTELTTAELEYIQT
jgi:hypothetical protein